MKTRDVTIVIITDQRGPVVTFAVYQGTIQETERRRFTSLYHLQGKKTVMVDGRIELTRDAIGREYETAEYPYIKL